MKKKWSDEQNDEDVKVDFDFPQDRCRVKDLLLLEIFRPKVTERRLSVIRDEERVVR